MKGFREWICRWFGGHKIKAELQNSGSVKFRCEKCGANLVPHP